MKKIYPEFLPPKTDEQFGNDFRAIGTNLSANARSIDPNIEETLLYASIEGVNYKDGRIAGILVDWLTIHSLRINVDRLTDLVFRLNDTEYWWVKIFWFANAQRFYPIDARFKRLATAYQGKRIDFVDRDSSIPQEPSLTEMYIKMKGADERFEETCIRVPKNYFSHRPQQVFPASSIAKKHMAFRYRVMMGANYRADIWALLRRSPDLSAYRLAKLAHCSVSAANRVKHDYEIVKRDYSKRKVA